MDATTKTRNSIIDAVPGKLSRNPIIDVMKGLAILCVVWGHVVANNLSNFSNNISFNIVYSFHMPLFFVVAGLVLGTGRYESWIKNKAIYLLIPCVIVNILTFWMGQHNNFPLWLVQAFVLIQGDWFLWTMFWVLAIIGLIVKSGKFFWMSVGLTVLIIVVLPPTNLFGVDQIYWYLPFTLIGYLTAKFGVNRKAVIIAAVCYIPIMFLTHWQGGWTHFGLTEPLQSIPIFGTRLVQALAGISVIAVLAYVLQRVKILQFLGQYSISIYLINFLFDSLGFGSGWFRVTTAFVISLWISVGLIFVLRKVSWMSRWFPAKLKAYN